MGRYELAIAADQDFENIFNDGIDRFGVTRALNDQNGLKQRFRELTEQARLYASVDPIHKGYRRSVYHAHSIYYRVESEHILIVRILGRQNPVSAFS